MLDNNVYLETGMEAIVDTVKDFIAGEIMHGSVKGALDPELHLLEEGVLDSLGLQQLITFLEEKYNITVDDEDLLPENFATVNAIAELISKQV